MGVVLQSEERRLLADAFGRLSASDQDVLELRVLAGLGAEQVARADRAPRRRRSAPRSRGPWPGCASSSRG